MCLSAPTESEKRRLRAWLNSSPSDKLAWLMNLVAEVKKDYGTDLGYRRSSGRVEYLLYARCEDGCEMLRSTAGDTSSCCYKCGNWRPELEQWLLDRQMFRCWWAGVSKQPQDHIFAPSYIRPARKEKRVV